jgi:transposase-like protein
MTEHEVWGFKIRKSASGKNIWPNEVKWEATRRIREDGQSAGDVAAELGAHECLVRKWSVADRRHLGEKIQVEGPAFTAVSFEGKEAIVETPAPTTATSGIRSNSGRILCGVVAIEFPLEISAGDLVKLVQVAGQFQ